MEPLIQLLAVDVRLPDLYGDPSAVAYLINVNAFLRVRREQLVVAGGYDAGASVVRSRRVVGRTRYRTCVHCDIFHNGPTLSCRELQNVIATGEAGNRVDVV